MEMSAKHEPGGHARGRESAKNITQGTDEKDGTGRDNRSATVERSLERDRWIVDRLDRSARNAGPGARARTPTAREGSAPSCRRSPRTTRPAASSIPATSLSCIAPKSSVTRDQPMSLQMRRQRPRAGRVMRGIDQNLHTAYDETLEPCRPLRIRQALPHGVVRDTACPDRASSSRRATATAALSRWCRPAQRERHADPAIASGSNVDRVIPAA